MHKTQEYAPELHEIVKRRKPHELDEGITLRKINMEKHHSEFPVKYGFHFLVIHFHIYILVYLGIISAVDMTTHALAWRNQWVPMGPL